MNRHKPTKRTSIVVFFFFFVSNCLSESFGFAANFAPPLQQQPPQPQQPQPQQPQQRPVTANKDVSYIHEGNSSVFLILKDFCRCVTDFAQLYLLHWEFHS